MFKKAFLPVALGVILSACGSSDSSDAPIDNGNIQQSENNPQDHGHDHDHDRDHDHDTPTPQVEYKFSAAEVNYATEISDLGFNGKAFAKSITATQNPNQFVVKLDLNNTKYYLLDAAKTAPDQALTLKASDEINLNAAMGMADSNHALEWVTKDNQLVVYTGDYGTPANQFLYRLPIKTGLKAADIEQVAMPTGTMNFTQALTAYDETRQILYIGDPKSEAPQLFSVDLSKKPLEVKSFKANLEAMDIGELVAMELVANKDKAYLWLSHKSKDLNNKVLSVFDAQELAQGKVTKLKTFFEDPKTNASKLALSPDGFKVLAVSQDDKNISQINVIDSGIHPHGDHFHYEEIKLLGALKLNANYFSPKQIYHRNADLGVLWQAKPYQATAPSQFTVLSDALLGKVADANFKAPSQTVANVGDGRALVVGDQYILASVQSPEDITSNQANKVQLFQFDKTSNQISAKQTFAPVCEGIDRSGQSAAYSLFACANKMVVIKQQSYSK